MGILGRVIAIVSLTVAPLLLPAAASALDAGRINDIRRASSLRDLERLAEKFLRDDAGRRPEDAEDSIRIAAEAQVYLEYIQHRQVQMMWELYQEQKEESSQ